MANRVGKPSEPGVVADFNARNHYKLSGTGGFIWTRAESDNPVRIGGDNSLVLFAIALLKSALLVGLFLERTRLSSIVSDPPWEPAATRKMPQNVLEFY
jgi:hypothetical protein